VLGLGIGGMKGVAHCSITRTSVSYSQPVIVCSLNCFQIDQLSVYIKCVHYILFNQSAISNLLYVYINDFSQYHQLVNEFHSSLILIHLIILYFFWSVYNVFIY